MTTKAACLCGAYGEITAERGTEGRARSVVQCQRDLLDGAIGSAQQVGRVEKAVLGNQAAGVG